ncbi:hypothetical protein [Salinarimonas soli]|uniref:Uncharacterized protein n=1 Tax=Salinarimonas soli TaxID=1638099 RepID=A0A5B2VA32_9HYPH|nr:hypothetical protein [Salinarimonas soli]KAA2235871.1 hypothetical protein F0L46_17675 [Salinarimonas soli]
MREVSGRTGLSFKTHAFQRIWADLVAECSEGHSVTLGGEVIRMAACRIKGVDRWCLHESALPLIVASVEPPPQRLPRPPGWLMLCEAAELLAGRVDPKVMAQAWRHIAERALKGEAPKLFGTPSGLVRMHLTGLNRWVVATSEVEGLARVLERVFPALPHGFITSEDIRQRLFREVRPLVPGLLAHLHGSSVRMAPRPGVDDGPSVRRCFHTGQPIHCLDEQTLPAFTALAGDTFDRMIARELEADEALDADDDVSVNFAP